MKLTAGGPKPPQAQLNNSIKNLVKQAPCGKIKISKIMPFNQNTDKILRLYLRLQALKQNLPTEKLIHQRYVEEYNNILVGLEQSSEINLAEFVILSQDLKRMSKSQVLLSNGDDLYSDDEYCEKELFLLKIDSLLSYFSVHLSREKPAIGFEPPKK